MILRAFGIIILCVLIFALGFLLGGFNWEWAENKHTSEVAFWSMIGGWLSAFATLVAVLVSLHMAYRAVQSESEKIRVFHGVATQAEHGQGVNCSIMIQNMRNLKVNVTGIYYSLGNSSSRYSLERVIGQQVIPLTYKGETGKFHFTIDSGVAWWGTYNLFRIDDEINFKKGKLFVTTELKTYESKLPGVFLNALEEAYSRYMERE